MSAAIRYLREASNAALIECGMIAAGLTIALMNLVQNLGMTLRLTIVTLWNAIH
jgi:Flp pilus assembly pilin Flp